MGVDTHAFELLLAMMSLLEREDAKRSTADHVVLALLDLVDPELTEEQHARLAREFLAYSVLRRKRRHGDELDKIRAAGENWLIMEEFEGERMEMI